MKPIVLYDSTAPSDIVVGRGAYVLPINHSSREVSNTTTVLTSKVVRYNKLSGEFETKNTIYKPIKSKSQLKRIKAQKET